MKYLKLSLYIIIVLSAVSLVTYKMVTGVSRMSSATAMADAGNKFLASLAENQKAIAQFKFDDGQRFDWHYIPRDRKGIPLKQLNDNQRKLALDFMKTGLSSYGYNKAQAIIDLEPILKELENGSPRRDPELYYFSIFGVPSKNEVWGWRIEGHHLSLNYTVVNGEMVSNTPHFFGANPAEVKQGPKKGLRVLAAEEDKARALIQSLDDKQKAIAIFSKEAPNDNVTANNRKADPLKPDGLAYQAMTDAQKKSFVSLLEEYLSRMPQDIANDRRTKLKAAGYEKIYFAWAGGINRYEPHYYRIQGPTFLVEYDDTQNNANHIHTVWRDFNGDFGEDLIQKHYKASNHHKH